MQQPESRMQIPNGHTMATILLPSTGSDAPREIVNMTLEIIKNFQHLTPEVQCLVESYVLQVYIVKNKVERAVTLAEIDHTKDGLHKLFAETCAAAFFVFLGHEGRTLHSRSNGHGEFCVRNRASCCNPRSCPFATLDDVAAFDRTVRSAIAKSLKFSGTVETLPEIHASQAQDSFGQRLAAMIGGYLDVIESEALALVNEVPVEDEDEQVPSHGAPFERTDPLDWTLPSDFSSILRPVVLNALIKVFQPVWDAQRTYLQRRKDARDQLDAFVTQLVSSVTGIVDALTQASVASASQALALALFKINLGPLRNPRYLEDLWRFVNAVEMHTGFPRPFIVECLFKFHMQTNESRDTCTRSQMDYLYFYLP